ncbi:hypothetical protein [Antrihabitans cavernicola]|uniref:Uncharacterized protein n=1 Tax=Antrihabitans cavernicola TaxID=2495913 RepID=A0A5A7SA55_9NOCA|nr:hypothetical protein [Spelaeibacter cavernicola]KAA0023030.1 hypothetical protein FOY51_11085 [Spelaeibacter cavernicola]
MSTDAEQPQSDLTDQADAGEAPEPTEEMIEKAKKDMEGLSEQYTPGARKTVAVPGTDGTVAGTAFEEHVNQMSDEEKEKADKSMAEFKADQEERFRDKEPESDNRAE